MAIELADNIQTGAPKPTDSRYLNNLVPYTGVTEVNSLITGGVGGIRYTGLTVNINNVEYWYKDGITDPDLVEKTSGTGNSVLAWTGSTSNAVGTYMSISGICAQPNLTFNGSTLSVTGNVNTSTYVCSPIITGSTKVCSPIVCGTTCVASPIVCGTTSANAVKFIENGTCLASTYLGISATANNASCLGGDLANTYAKLASPTFTGIVITPVIKITSGATSGCVLTSSADGIGCWCTPTSGGIDWTGSTANGVGTYSSVGTICSEPNLIFDGTTLAVTGTVTWTDGCSTNANTAYTHSIDNTQAHSDYMINSGDTGDGSYIFRKSANDVYLDLASYSVTNTHQGYLYFKKSASNTLGTNLAVAEDESLGKITWNAPRVIDNVMRVSAKIDVTAHIDSGDTNRVGGDMHFYLENHGTSIREVMTILADGNVGIGTVTPSYKLDIQNGAASTPVGIKTFSTTNGHTPMLFFMKSASNTLGTLAETSSGDYLMDIRGYGVNTGSGYAMGARILSLQTAAANATYVPSDLRFYTHDVGQHLALYIQEDGKVGINTSTPSETLEVEGSTRITRAGVPTQYLNFTTTSGGHVFDTAGGKGLSFKNEGNLGIVIDTAGKVGIGTTTPLAQVHIQSATPDLWIKTNVGSSGKVGEIRFISDVDARNARIEGYRGSSSEKMSLKFFTYKESEAVEAMIINDLGNVGIGTPAPSNALDVIGSVEINNNANHLIMKESDNSDKRWDVHVTSGDLYFTEFGVANQMVILSGGSVGIGTISPNEKLEVVGKMRLTGTGNVIQLHRNPATQSNYIQYYDSIGSAVEAQVGYTGADDIFRIYNLNADSLILGTNSTARLTILSDGKVGINDSTPSYQLDVNGTGRYTGALYANSHIHLNSNASYIYFGAADSGRILQNGTDFYFNSYSHGGRFLFQGENEAGDNKALIYADPDGAVTLYHAGYAKLATTATGVNITGLLTSDTAVIRTDVDSALNILTIQNENTGVSAGALLSFDTLGNNLYLGNFGDNHSVYGANHSRLYTTAGGGNIGIGSGSELGFLWTGNGAVDLYYDNVKKFNTLSTGTYTTGTHCSTTCSRSPYHYSSTCACSPVVCATTAFRSSSSGGYHFCATLGCGCAVDWVATSDCRMKKNIEPITSALSKVDALCGVCYEFCGDGSLNMGLIAQDVICVEPRLVSHGEADEFHKEKYGIEDETLGLKYDKFAGLFVEAIKELKVQNECLQLQIISLRHEIKK